MALSPASYATLFLHFICSCFIKFRLKPASCPSTTCLVEIPSYAFQSLIFPPPTCVSEAIRANETNYRPETRAATLKFFLFLCLRLHFTMRMESEAVLSPRAACLLFLTRLGGVMKSMLVNVGLFWVVPS